MPDKLARRLAICVFAFSRLFLRQILDFHIEQCSLLLQVGSRDAAFADDRQILLIDDFADGRLDSE